MQASYLHRKSTGGYKFAKSQEIFVWISEMKLYEFIIQVFRTIAFIFILIFLRFRPMCPPAFFRYFLSNLLAYMDIWTTSFN